MTEEIKELKLFSWIGRLSIVKMSNLPKSVHRVNTTTLNIPPCFLEEKDNLILKSV